MRVGLLSDPFIFIDMIEDILNSKYDEVLDELFISEKGDHLRLHSIILKDGVKEEGYGTKIMDDIIDYADKNNMIVTLTASSSYGSSKGRLISFYKRFGFVPNKGRNKDYRFQDTLIREPKTMNEDKIKGGKADNLSIDDVAKHHGMDVDKIKGELKAGTEDEKEHTGDKSKASEIAKDHLMGNPEYYSKMDAAGIDEAAFPMIRRKIHEAVSRISVADETPKSTVYFIYDGERPLGGIEISNVSGSPSDDEATILNIGGDEKERPIKVIRDAIPLLFRTVPTMNRLYVPTNEHNRAFWERAGANRVGDGLHAFERGH